jgi:hypothetical protein
MMERMVREDATGCLNTIFCPWSFGFYYNKNKYLAYDGL